MKKRQEIDVEIQIREWKEYFMGLLGKWRKRLREERRKRREMEADIEWEKVKRTINNLELNKTIGLDEISNEYGDMEERK